MTARRKFIHTYVHTYVRTYIRTYVHSTDPCVLKVKGCGTSHKNNYTNTYCVKCYKVLKNYYKSSLQT